MYWQRQAKTKKTNTEDSTETRRTPYTAVPVLAGVLVVQLYRVALLDLLVVPANRASVAATTRTAVVATSRYGNSAYTRHYYTVGFLLVRSTTVGDSYATVHVDTPPPPCY